MDVGIETVLRRTPLDLFLLAETFEDALTSILGWEIVGVQRHSLDAESEVHVIARAGDGFVATSLYDRHEEITWRDTPYARPQLLAWALSGVDEAGSLLDLLQMLCTLAENGHPGDDDYLSTDSAAHLLRAALLSMADADERTRYSTVLALMSPKTWAEYRRLDHYLTTEETPESVTDFLVGRAREFYPDVPVETLHEIVWFHVQDDAEPWLEAPRSDWQTPDNGAGRWRSADDYVRMIVDERLSR